jgi:creatinine amidohydrolase/Fe(II)-dependent formamide hydrolase-like protein
MIAQFVHLKESELKALLPELTLVIFPVGGLEQHGPHLPFGTKLIQSREWISRFTQKLEANFPNWNFIIMPELPFTVDTYTTSAAISVRPHVVRDALVDQCFSLRKMGFLQFAALSTHLTPKQLAAIEDAAIIVSRKSKGFLISLSSGLINKASVFKSPAIALPEEHAGAFDTGLMLAACPQLVGSDRSGLTPIPAPSATMSRFIDHTRGKLGGYWGNPSDADANHSKAKLETDLDRLIDRIKPVLEKGKGRGSFVSGYRWYPFNGSFFKAYLLAAFFFVIMFFWFLAGLKDVFE